MAAGEEEHFRHGLWGGRRELQRVGFMRAKEWVVLWGLVPLEDFGS